MANPKMVTRYTIFTDPNGKEHRIAYEVDEAEEAARGADPDYDKAPAQVLKECSEAVDEVHPGRSDLAALTAVVRRLIRVMSRGIGTSPSEPGPVDPSAS